MEEKISRVCKRILGAYSSDLSMANTPQWDSLKHIQLLTALEREFSLALRYKDTLQMTSVPAIMTVLKQYCSQQEKSVQLVSDATVLPHQRLGKPFQIEHQNIYQLFCAQKNSSPDKEFLFFPDKQQVFTYAQFGEQFLKVAAVLNQHLQQGERICLIIPTSSSFVTLYFAGLALGLVIVPINPDLSSPEMEYIIKDSQAKAVFFDPTMQRKVQAMNVQSGVGFHSSETVLKEKCESSSSTSQVRLTDEAVIIYTSGTTGNPKGVVLTHLNLLADAKAISEWFAFSPETRTLCLLPLFHNNGQVVTLLSPLYAGGSTVMVQAKASLMTFWHLVEKYAVNWTSVMPSILSILLSLPAERRDNSMAGIICGGQPLTPEVQQQFEDRFKVPVFEGYGLTETTSFACFNTFSREQRKRGSVGRALPVNKITIRDDQDHELSPYQEGEICIRGLNVANEYFMLSEKNGQAFRNGWFRSGDYGYIDEDGCIYFKTRKDFLIIKGGENIYPSEIENVFFKHPEVAECAVIGIHSKLLGQDLCAFVKLREHSSAEKKELQEFMMGKIAGYKQPKEIIIINRLSDMDEIPKGPTKKVLYRELDRYYREKLYKEEPQRG